MGYPPRPLEVRGLLGETLAAGIRDGLAHAFEEVVLEDFGCGPIIASGDDPSVQRVEARAIERERLRGLPPLGAPSRRTAPSRLRCGSPQRLDGCRMGEARTEAMDVLREVGADREEVPDLSGKGRIFE